MINQGSILYNWYSSSLWPYFQILVDEINDNDDHHLDQFRDLQRNISLEICTFLLVNDVIEYCSSSNTEDEQQCQSQDIDNDTINNNKKNESIFKVRVSKIFQNNL